MGGKSKRFGERTSKLRKRVNKAEFIALFNANPCNKLPGQVLQSLYRKAKDTKSLNELASNWLAAEAARVA